MSQGLRTIVVGFGQIAAGLGADARMARHFDFATHAQVLAEHPRFQWLGVVDPDPQAQAAARTEWNIAHAGPDLGEVAAAVDAEVAVITAPPGTRVEAVEGLAGLKAVMVEKPLDTGGAGDRLSALCRGRGILAQVNFWRRGVPFYRDLAHGRLDGLAGKCQGAFATYGNGLFNNAGHLVDLVRMLLGEIAAVQALGEAVPAAGAPLAGYVQLPFALFLEAGPVVAFQPLDFRRYREVGLDIWGTGGRLALYQEGLGAHHYPLAPNRGLEGAFEIASDTPQSLDPGVGRALYFMYDNLAAAVGGNEALWSPLESGLRTERALAAVIRSAEAGGAKLEVE